MKLVVDTNCIISALIRDGTARKIISHASVELISVEYSKEEILEHKDEIVKKSGTSEATIELLLETILQKMNMLDYATVKKHIEPAREIMQQIDVEDSVFVAAALASGASIWSEDHHLKKQNKVQVFSTKELVEKLGL